LEAEQDTVRLPGKETAEYWVIRSQALTEFVPFLTQKRAEFQEVRKLMRQYLDETGKASDYLASGVKAPDTAAVYAQALGLTDELARLNVKLPEKPATWEQLVTVAMEHTIFEGYFPTDVASGEELTTIKRICGQKETYGKKVRSELHDTIRDCMNIWTYLGTINAQAECRTYVYREKEAARIAKEEELRQRREARVATGREVRAQQQIYREAQREARNQEAAWAKRQARMGSRYGGYRW
jgi:hypothetical protein